MLLELEIDENLKQELKKNLKNKTIAEILSKDHREISVAEFFEKNRHLLGFDNPRKALLTTVKEAVDNSLDACEDARILPEIKVDIIDMGKSRYRVIIEDNGPGIIKKNVPLVFGKLLYGSKFHKLKQSRGQQGIGISAAVLYSQLTTGRPVKILSKIGKDHKAYYCELKINTRTNEPEIVKEEERDWFKEHGTRIELDIEASYYRGSQSVDEYIKQTAIINPHATIIYTNPLGEQKIYTRVTEQLPKIPKEIKPHPYGVELGLLIKMLNYTKEKNIKKFLIKEFSRVSEKVANEILLKSSIPPEKNPKEITREEAERLINAIKNTKIMVPSSDCLSPIGEELLEKGLKKEINAEFYAVSSRSPSVYRGYPFIIEVGLAYGGLLKPDEPAIILRFANRIPLLYQSGSCAFTKTVIAMDWKKYGLNQPKGSLPIAPLLILIHIASVWVPYTSESKEAIASYPEIMREVKLALQDVGRKLLKYLSKKKRVKEELKRRSDIEKYIPHISLALNQLLDLDKNIENELSERLKAILESTRGKIEDIEFDASKNVEYDEEFAVEQSSLGIVDEIDVVEEDKNESDSK